jgi:hypothetical protein
MIDRQTRTKHRSRGTQAGGSMTASFSRMCHPCCDVSSPSCMVFYHSSMAFTCWSCKGLGARLQQMAQGPDWQRQKEEEPGSFASKVEALGPIYHYSLPQWRVPPKEGCLDPGLPQVESSRAGRHLADLGPIMYQGHSMTHSVWKHAGGEKRLGRLLHAFLGLSSGILPEGFGGTYSHLSSSLSLPHMRWLLSRGRS